MIPMADPAAQYAGIRADVEPRLREVLASGRYLFGPEVAAFERKAAAWLGAQHAVTCGSGTDALRLALTALGIGAGHEVITTPFTFFATAEAVCQAGARPVFVDIDSRTFNIDPERVEAAVTPATRAILPVHLFGGLADMASLTIIAERHGLYVVEDCAQCFGARQAGRAAGTLGTAGACSFFPSKNLGACGDGGMVATSSDTLAATVRQLRNHGATEPGCHEAVGLNSGLDELQADILRAKLPRLGDYNRARRQAARRYSRALRDLPGVAAPPLGSAEEHVFHQYTVLVDSRDAVREALRRRGVESALYYPLPLHRQPASADRAAPALPVAEAVAARCLSLPIYPEITAAQIDTVTAALRACLD